MANLSGSISQSGSAKKRSSSLTGQGIRLAVAVDGRPVQSGDTVAGQERRDAFGVSEIRPDPKVAYRFKLGPVGVVVRDAADEDIFVVTAAEHAAVVTSDEQIAAGAAERAFPPLPSRMSCPSRR